MILVTGGVRSGKSSFAEQLAILKRKKRLIYLATSIPYDNEMKDRMKRHQQMRIKSGEPWLTIEQSKHLATLQTCLQKDDVVLLDCLPTWLSNELFIDESSFLNPTFQRYIYEEMIATIRLLDASVKQLIIVSNDVFSNAEQFFDGTFHYMRLLGHLHQWIVSQAKEVYDVQFGLVEQKKEVVW